MANYKTSGEYTFLVVPVIFFVINLLFQKLLHPYIQIGYWWLILFIAYPIVHFLQFKVNTVFTHRIYHMLVGLFMLQLIFVFLGLFNILIKLVFGIALFMPHLLILSSVIFLTGYMYFHNLKIERMQFKSKKINKKTRIVQISDVHAHGALATKYIKDIVDKTIKEKPDIVVVTGDLFDYFGLPAKDSLKSFEKIKCPIYYIYGNHERDLLNDYAEYLINNSKLIPLVNDYINFNEFQIIGIDYSIDKKEMLSWFKKQKIDNNQFVLLLQHVPVNVKEICKKHVDLMLAGHTHAGQTFPLTLYFKFFVPFYKGFYEINKTKVYVSRGTGTKSFPFRLFVRNELTVIDLVPED